jgi:hypothetical protein
MPGLVPGIHALLLKMEKERRGWPGIGERSDAVLRTAMPGHDEDDEIVVETTSAYFQHRAGSPTISGCRASETAGDIRITSAWAPKIATAR